jgi:hypothetical protein
MVVLYRPDVALGASAHAGVRHHHCDEIAVDITGRLDRHIRHHLFYGGLFSNKHGCSSEPFDRSAKYWIGIAPRI